MKNPMKLLAEPNPLWGWCKPQKPPEILKNVILYPTYILKNVKVIQLGYFRTHSFNSIVNRQERDDLLGASAALYLSSIYVLWNQRTQKWHKTVTNH